MHKGRDRIRQQAVTLPFAQDTTLFTYNATHLRDAVSSLRIGGQNSPWALGYTYDTYGRMQARQYYTQSLATPAVTWGYTYATYNGNPTAQVQSEGTHGQTYSYEYDANGNITSISRNGTLQARYTYDTLDRLTRVDSAAENKSYVYAYDGNGNILSRKQYAYTTGDLGTAQSTVSYGYNDAAWSDLLTSYNGQTFTYDTIGNPLQWRDGMTLSWQNGRQLSTLQKSGLSASYSYDEQGIRISKTANGVTTAYYTAGSVLLGESRSDGTEILYYYDENGAPFALQYNGVYYHYLRNIQGDIVGLLNAQGTVVAQYTYDAWGKLLSVTNASGTAITDQTHVGNINPLRYRGYYYDTDSGLYYLQTRYYDPEVGRFLNPDDPSIVTATPMELTDLNLFAYCDNNPIMRADNGGEFWHILVGAVVGAVVSAVSAVLSGGDVVDVVIATVAGAASGALTASGAGVVAQAIGGAAISMASNAASQVNDICNDATGQTKMNWSDMLFDGAVSLICGRWGDNGASYGNSKGIMTAGKQLFKRGLFNPKARSYYVKTAHNAKGVFVFKDLFKSLGKNTLGTAVVTVKNIWAS